MFLALYVKPSGAKRFLPLDASNGTLVDRRIFMSLWSREDRETVQEWADEIRELNPGAQVEIREVK